jgi:hypothetical protein
MAKSDLEAQRKSSLSDCTWLENEFGSFNLEALKFLMHFREAGSLFYLYSYSHFFSHTYFFGITFFFFLSLSHFFFFFLINFFICSPLTLKLHCTYLLLYALDVCSSSGKEVIKIRLVKEILFLYRGTVLQSSLN